MKPITLSYQAAANTVTTANASKSHSNSSSNSTSAQCIALAGSKYLANRYIILATLARARVSLKNLPDNEDINHALAGIEQLGVKVERQAGHCLIDSTNLFELSSQTSPSIYAGDSGTFSRFILPLLALQAQPITLCASKKMSTRPMQDLTAALIQMGVQITSANVNDSVNDNTNAEMRLPLTVRGPVTHYQVEMSGKISSQYISGLLMAACALDKPFNLTLTEPAVSKPFIEMTLNCMRVFNCQVKVSDNYQYFEVSPGLEAPAKSVVIETDPSSASYFLASAMLSNQPVIIDNFNPQQSVQGEAKFYQLLEQMGAQVDCSRGRVSLSHQGSIKGINVDMNALPDVVQTLAIVAAFADSPTTITNIANLAFKESNRIEDTASELRKLGAVITTTSDSMLIEPITLNNQQSLPEQVCFDCYDDHRMAMSLALAALRIPKVKINQPHVVAKSFPDYWQYLEQLGYAITQDKQKDNN